MFSSKPTTVLVLSAKSLAFYNGKEEEKDILEFPATILKKEEVMNWDKFTLLVEEFLARNSLKKQHAIMILGKDVVFEKTFPKDTEVSAEDEEKFIKSAPFEKDMVMVKRLED